MEQQKTILSVQDMHIVFPGAVPFTAVSGLSLGLPAGRTLAIVGESGSGKSLTALALMGLLPRTASLSGKIELLADGRTHDLANLQDQHAWQQIRGRHAGMVFQEPMSALNPVMRVGLQLREAIRAHQQVSGAEAEQQVVEWLRKVQLPDPAQIYKRYPHQLSGGQKQRVMIAMAMCNHPVLLIADEPTTALDVTVQQEVIRLMQQLQQQSGTALIFITHDLALAATIADQVLVMYQGRVMEYGDARDVLRSPQHPYTQALIACKPSPGHKNKRLPVVADFLDEDKATAKEDAIDKQQVQTPVSAETLLKVNNLRVWFPGSRNWLGKPLSYFKAVDDVSFELKRGEVLGLVGESGCGKSTLSKSLLGLLPLRDGQILFSGQDLARLAASEWPLIRRKVQMIFQDPYASLNPRMTVGDIIMEPMKVHGIVPAAELKHEAAKLLDMVHLPADSFRRYPHQFSGGQRQRIGIARALSLRPELIICDESVSALDVSVQAQILNLLKDLQQEFDLTYLFISHDLSVVHYISDRVMVMKAGKLVEHGKAEKVLFHPENDYTKKLVAAMPIYDRLDT